MSELPELPRGAPRHWLEYVSTFVAVIISVVSLWVAIESEQANRQMVAASSWPFLQVGSSNVDSTGRSTLLFSITDTGVGPAKVRPVEVFYKGRPYDTAVDLIRACCKPDFKKTPPSTPEPSDEAFITGGTAGTVIRAGESRAFITYGLGPHTAPVWHALDHARDRDITFRICYCSVFDECWRNTLTGRNELDPVRVDKCPVPPVPYQE
jgi:hypothetical protein